MERKLKIVTAGLAVIAVIAMIGGIVLSGACLNKALKKIDQVQGDLDKTMNVLHFSKSKIDSMQKELSAYRIFIQDIKGRVEIIDLENRKDQGRFVQKKDSIKNRLDCLYKQYGISNSIVEISEL